MHAYLLISGRITSRHFARNLISFIACDLVVSDWHVLGTWVGGVAFVYTFLENLKDVVQT